ncbi:MAG: hypothetical protein IJV67_01975 [Clostridia bacterium]|nr:hypothetical protein [Clostridia bacterium]MBR2968825.1 hypothetical protein [Clostridia bacterium]
MKANGWRCVLIYIAAAVACVYLALPQLDGDGTREYFLKPSSSSTRVDAEGSISLSALLASGAESVFFSGECNEAALIESFSARVVFVERVGDAVSYYCYSPHLRGEAIIDGRRINLHLCVASYGYTVGTPFICGSF